MNWFIPSLMYPVYLEWLKTTNIATKPITQRKFSSQILKQARKENLLNDKCEPTTKRLKYLMLNDNDLTIFLDKHNLDANKGKPVRIYRTTYHN